MNPALETLMLAFAGEDGPAVPSRALFLGAEPHPALAEWPEVIGWQPFKPLADAWETAGFPRIDEPSGDWPLVMILPGKSRDETLALFATARRHLAPGGTLVAALPNRAGAARFEKELAGATGGVTSISKNKCRAFHAIEDGSWDEAVFDAWRPLGEPRPIAEGGFVTRAGIFSPDHVDPASAFLAAHLPAHVKGNVADLGAGWGFLSAAVLDRCPAVEGIDLHEADARALDCARRNLADSDRELRFLWHDVAAGVDGNYDAVVMNPPFHRGQHTDVDLGRAFIRSAATALKRGGRLFMVANRQLPYEAGLDACGLIWRCAAENPTYKLLFADRR